MRYWDIQFSLSVNLSLSAPHLNELAGADAGGQVGALCSVRLNRGAVCQLELRAMAPRGPLALDLESRVLSIPTPKIRAQKLSVMQPEKESQAAFVVRVDLEKATIRLNVHCRRKKPVEEVDFGKLKSTHGKAAYPFKHSRSSKVSGQEERRFRVLMCQFRLIPDYKHKGSVVVKVGEPALSAPAEFVPPRLTVQLLAFEPTLSPWPGAPSSVKTVSFPSDFPERLGSHWSNKTTRKTG
ncbi:hypothetical protein DKX38_030094 (mitochondrion) [Salix brachista]|uniref:Uncharacterized protein n=1 Tax=Salix brachista TaxID=2182728 RepID=A0A5N5IVH5_9ROSI|nr:hypothetical protein DKX38_030094 [Salix brachista]